MRNSVLQSLAGHRVTRPNWGSMMILAMLMAIMPLALSTRVNAQSSSAVLSGHVIDKSQGVVPNAAIRLIEETTQFTTSTHTNATGDFIFTNVQPGTYTAVVTAPGYKEMRKVGLIMYAQQNLSAGTLVLTVGAESQSVTVQADIAPLQSTSSERSGTLDNTQIEDLLTIGRDPMALLRILPGMVNGGNSDSLTQYSTPTMNGINSEYNMVTVDGIVANPRAIGAMDSSFNLDTIKEITVEQSNYQAQYGKTAGASINMVTKNGTQHFHGGLYEYFRNEDLNANSWANKYGGANKARSRYRYNTMGGTVGGPVYWPGHFNTSKDKLFFFFSYEYAPTTSPDGLRYFKIPTKAEINGDFSSTYNTGTSTQDATTLVHVKDPTSTASCSKNSTTAGTGCFAGNVIPSGRINTSGQALLKLAYNRTTVLHPENIYNNVSVSNNNYNYITNTSTSNPDHQYVMRFDYAPTEKMRMFFHAEQASICWNDMNSWLFKVNYCTTQPNLGYNITYSITPTLVNEFSIGMGAWGEKQTFNASDIADFTLSSSGFNLPSLYSGVNPLNLLPNTSYGIANNPTIGWNYRFPYSNYARAVSMTDNITKVLGNHTLKAGIDLGKDVYRQKAQNQVGSFNFSSDSSNASDSNWGYANALLGVLDSYSQNTKLVSPDPSEYTIEWYYQDTWKAAHNLTLDFGLRSSYAMAQRIPAGNNWDASLYNAANAPTLYTYDSTGTHAVDPTTGILYPKAYVGKFVPNTGTVDNGVLYMNSGKSGYPKYGVFDNGLLSAPRVGFSWEFTPKTILRGGFGIFYNVRARTNGQQGDFATNAPSTMGATQYYSSINSSDSNYYMNVGSLKGPYSVGHAIDMHAKIPYGEEASFGIQRQLPRGLVLDVSYVGTFSKHVSGRVNVNEVPYGAEFKYSHQSAAGTLSDDFYRPYMGLSSISMHEFGLTSNYNGLQVKATRRFHNGFEYGVAYTWSRAFDYTDDFYKGSVATYQKLRTWNYSIAGWDVRHNLVVNYLYKLPKASSAFGDGFFMNNPLTRVAFDHWQISGIASYLSGTPDNIGFSVSSGQNIAGGGDGSRLVQTCDPWSTKIPHVTRTFKQWFNTNCFVPPIGGSIGTASNPDGTQMSWGIGKPMPRYNVFYPGVTNFDTALLKDFPVKDKVKMQFRLETYNTFNHTEWSGINDSATFATANSQDLTVNPQKNSTFGQLNATKSPRRVQLALRLDF